MSMSKSLRVVEYQYFRECCDRESRELATMTFKLFASILKEINYLSNQAKCSFCRMFVNIFLHLCVQPPNLC